MCGMPPAGWVLGCQSYETVIKLRETPKFRIGEGRDAEAVESLQFIATKYNRPFQAIDFLTSPTSFIPYILTEFVLLHSHYSLR